MNRFPNVIVCRHADGFRLGQKRSETELTADYGWVPGDPFKTQQEAVIAGAFLDTKMQEEADAKGATRQAGAQGSQQRADGQTS